MGHHRTTYEHSAGSRPAVSVQQTAGSDPYFPANGDARYRVHRYELALDYRPGPNRLGGHGPDQRDRAAAQPLAEFQLEPGRLPDRRGSWWTARPPHYTHRGGRLRIRPAEAAAGRRRVHRRGALGGQPQAGRQPLGRARLGGAEDGALVASQPIGAPSWYPCNDRPADKARTRSRSPRRPRTRWWPAAGC